MRKPVRKRGTCQPPIVSGWSKKRSHHSLLAVTRKGGEHAPRNAADAADDDDEQDVVGERDAEGLGLDRAHEHREPGRPKSR